jgi:hypothetical protein
MDMTSSLYKSFLLSLVLFGVAAFVSSPLLAGEVPEFSGAYSGSLVWQDEVTMAGDVLILEGGDLTIRAGTQVNVVPAEGTKIDPEYLSALTELLIRGRLDIQGTPEAPVRFVIVERDDLEDIAWAGITLDHAMDSRIIHVELERADVGIRCVRSSPKISGNQIARSRYGIVAQQKSHPQIIGNTLRNGEAGIFCWKDSNPVLRDNLVVNHDEEAVFVDASSFPKLGRNTLRNNAIGLALYPRNLDYTAVIAADNKENLRWLGHQGQKGER